MKCMSSESRNGERPGKKKKLSEGEKQNKTKNSDQGTIDRKI